LQGSFFIVSTLGSFFRQSTKGLGSQAQLHATEALRLDVHLEGAATSNVGVAARITGTGSTAGQLAGAAHKSLLNSYKNQSIIPL
jgi:hypothetical protein